MIRYDDYVTSINFPQPFELFLTLGWFGVGGGMVAIGAIYRLISDLTTPRRRNQLALALYAMSVMTLTTSLGVIVVQGLVGEIRAMLVYAVVLFLLSGGVARSPVTKALAIRVAGTRFERY
jgi:MFS family permease